MVRSIRKQKPFKAFASQFSGRVVLPDDPGFDEARAVFNGMIDKRPALIAQCTSPADVTAALAYALGQGLEIAVRSGGHSVAGMSSVEGGAVIDVRPMKEIHIDTEQHIGRVGAGVTWGEFDQAAQEHGLATTGGRVSTTGVAGFTLGGGSGWLERTYGLACDNLLAVELVLADGRPVRATAQELPDLFWALHGGGGNYGVATAFEFMLHPVGPLVHAGLMIWPMASATDLAHGFRDFVATMPDEVGTGLVFLTGPPEPFIPPHLQGQPVCAIAVCYYGPIDDGEAVLAPLRALAPEVDLVQPMPYVEFQKMLDDPPGMRNYWSASYLFALSDDAIATVLKSSSDVPSPLTQNILFPWGGAVARVREKDTPMAQRDAAWIYHPFAVWQSPFDDAANIEWAKGAIADMQHFSSGGTYLNFIGDEGQSRIEAAFGPSYTRLRDLKWRYDKHNVFHLNQNIKV